MVADILKTPQNINSYNDSSPYFSLRGAAAAVFLCVNEMTGRITADCRHCEVITPRFNES